MFSFFFFHTSVWEWLQNIQEQHKDPGNVLPIPEVWRAGWVWAHILVGWFVYLGCESQLQLQLFDQTSSQCSLLMTLTETWSPSFMKGWKITALGEEKHFKSCKAEKQVGDLQKQRLLLVLIALNIRERKINIFLSQWWVRMKQNPHHPPERCLTIHLRATMLEGEVIPVSGPRSHLNSGSALDGVTWSSEPLLWPTWEFFIIHLIILISHWHWRHNCSSQRRNRHRNAQSVTSSSSSRCRLDCPDLPQCRWQMVGRTNLTALP